MNTLNQAQLALNEKMSRLESSIESQEVMYKDCLSKLEIAHFENDCTTLNITNSDEKMQKLNTDVEGSLAGLQMFKTQLNECREL
jgi:hypothetical protein